MSFEIIVSEVMYSNRQGEFDVENALEFLELKNVGRVPLDMSGWVLSGFAYEFDKGTVLAPQQIYTLARVPAKFQEFYGVAANNTRIIVSALANGGERLTLRTARQPVDPLLPDAPLVFQMSYSNDVPWPVMADDGGFSLVPRDPTGVFDLSDPARWRVSSQRNGSPTRDDPPPSVAEVVVNELLAYPGAADLTGDFVELANPTAAAVDLGGWALTDSLLNKTRFTFARGTSIAANGFLLLTATQLGFGFSSLGDSVFLLSRSPTTGLFSGYSHGFAFDASDVGRPFGRLVTGVRQERFALLERATPGDVNAPLIRPAAAVVEINYHPPTNETCKVEADCEYVRVRNVLKTELRLFDPELNNTPWRISSLNFSFPAGVTLAPGADVFITPALPDELRARVGLPASALVLGPAAGSLNNAGETVAVYRPVARASTAAPDSAQPYVVVDVVRYGDASPWPVDADGLGKSLHRCDALEYGDDASNWNVYAPCVRQTLPPTPPFVRTPTTAPTATQGNVGDVSLTTALIVAAVVILVLAAAAGVGVFVYRRRKQQKEVHSEESSSSSSSE